MRTLLLCLFGLLVLTGCPKKEKDDPKPQTPAEAVAGRYAMKSFRYADASNNVDLPTLPATQGGKTASGTVELTAVSSADDQLDLELTFNVTGEQDFVVPLSGLLVKKTAKGYALNTSGTEVATIENNKLVFSVSGTNQQGKVALACTAAK